MKTFSAPTNLTLTIAFCILSAPLLSSAQTLNMSQIETTKKKVAAPLTVPQFIKKAEASEKPQLKIETPVWFTPQFQKSFSGGVVTGGGDNDGIKFQALAASGLLKLKPKFTKPQNDHLQKALLSARFVVVNENVFASLPGVTQESVAVNDRETGLVKISRMRLNNINSSKKLESVSAHEVLSLVGFESTGQYPFSHQLLKDEGAIKTSSQVLFSEYNDTSIQGYDWDTAYQKCQTIKAYYEKDFYLVYCSYKQKRIKDVSESYWRRFDISYTYGLVVYGLAEQGTSQWKTVFSSLKYGTDGEFSDLFKTENEALLMCQDNLRQSANPRWIGPRCVVQKKDSEFYYEIQAQNLF